MTIVLGGSSRLSSVVIKPWLVNQYKDRIPGPQMAIHAGHSICNFLWTQKLKVLGPQNISYDQL